jgi:DNA-binding protein HU-beta
MTKSELVRELAEDFELPRRQVTELVEAILEKITTVLKSGDKVQLTPFGQFRIRDRAARIARNPQTGEPVNVPAKRVLKFTAGRTLKEAVGTPARKSAGAKKSTAKKAVAKKAVAKKAPAKKVAAKKAPVKKAPVKKAAAKKTVAKKKSR